MSKHLFYDLHDALLISGRFLFIGSKEFAILFAVHWPKNQEFMSFSTEYLSRFSLGEASTTKKNDDKNIERFMTTSEFKPVNRLIFELKFFEEMNA